MMIQFLKKFDEYPFLVKTSEKEFLIGREAHVHSELP